MNANLLSGSLFNYPWSIATNIFGDVTMLVLLGYAFFYNQFVCWPLNDTGARSTKIQVQHVDRISFWVVHVPRLE